MIEKVKKRYSAPELTAVVIDREITLVMATENWGNNAASNQGDKSGAAISNERSASPFGAKTPDYSNMRK